MGKFFKKAPAPKEESAQPKVETAVVLCLYEGGGKTVGFIKVDGIKMERPATLRDMKRMCYEVLDDLSVINVVDRLQAVLSPTVKHQPVPSTPLSEDVKPVEVSEAKSDEAKEKNEDDGKGEVANAQGSL